MLGRIYLMRGRIMDLKNDLYIIIVIIVIIIIIFIIYMLFKSNYYYCRYIISELK
jgi:cell division protein FtsL